MCYSQLLLSRARSTQGVSPVPRMGPGDGSATAKSKKSLSLSLSLSLALSLPLLSLAWWSKPDRSTAVAAQADDGHVYVTHRGYNKSPQIFGSDGHPVPGTQHAYADRVIGSSWKAFAFSHSLFVSKGVQVEPKL